MKSDHLPMQKEEEEIDPSLPSMEKKAKESTSLNEEVSEFRRKSSSPTKSRFPSDLIRSRNPTWKKNKEAVETYDKTFKKNKVANITKNFVTKLKVNLTEREPTEYEPFNMENADSSER